MSFAEARVRAQQLDDQDDLRQFKQQFYVKNGVIYLDGNSLGLLSKPAEQSLLGLLESWKAYGIDGWSQGREPWFDLSERLGSRLAPLVGASADEVIATGSTTVNLHQLVATFYQPTADRYKIVADELTFPSDIYALQSQLRLHGFNPDEALIRVRSRDGQTLDEADLVAAMTDDVALVLLPSVLYRSGQLLNLKALTQAAHERGIVIGFDLCHSIGAILHELSAWDVDFAFWCNYKYLNAGPGSVAGLYVNRRHSDAVVGLAGWFGSDKQVQFDMEHSFTPAHGVGKFQIGTPHVLSLAPLIGSLTLFEQAGINRIRNKSLKLTAFLMELIDEHLTEYGFAVGNPREDERRGGHVCLVHPEAARICKAMKVADVIPDFRAPDVIRLAPIALYTSFADVCDAVERIERIMTERTFEQFTNQREVIA